MIDVTMTYHETYAVGEDDCNKTNLPPRSVLEEGRVHRNRNGTLKQGETTVNAEKKEKEEEDADPMNSTWEGSEDCGNDPKSNAGPANRS